MKKQFLSLATACLLVAASASAQVEADLTIKHGTVAPTIDGDPSDAVWALIDPVPVEKQFTTDPEASVTAFFKMFYTDKYLYLLVDVTDDVHYPLWKNPDDAKQNYLYDKVEVYFDVNDNLKDGGSPAHNGANNPASNRNNNNPNNSNNNYGVRGYSNISSDLILQGVYAVAY